MMRAGLKSRRIAEPARAINTFWQMARKCLIRRRERSRVISMAQASLLIQAHITGVTKIGEGDHGGRQLFMNFMSDWLAASRASHGNCPVWQSLESPQSS